MTGTGRIRRYQPRLSAVRLWNQRRRRCPVVNHIDSDSLNGPGPRLASRKGDIDMTSGYLNHVRDIETLRKLVRDFEERSAREKRVKDTVRRFPGS